MSPGACLRTREMLPLYLEHEAGPAEALQTASHLVTCGACAGEAERQKVVSAALREMESPAPPADVASGVMARLRRMRSAAGAATALKWSAISLAVALLVLRVSIPAPVWQGGLRLLARLGELMDLDALLGPFFEQVARLLPNPASLFVGRSFGGLLPTAPGSTGPLGGWLPGFILAVGTLALIGALLVTAALLAPRPGFITRRRARPRF